MVSPERENNEANRPLRWADDAPPTAGAGLPYPDRLDAMGGCAFMALGMLGIATGIICWVTGAKVPFWMYVPLVIGILVALVTEARSTIRRRRWRAIAAPLEAWLGRRTLSLADAWGRRPERLERIGEICGTVKDHMGWPGDRFLPGDPLAIVLWNHHGTRDATLAMQEIEERYGIKVFRLLERVAAELKDNPDATFGDFADWVDEEIERSKAGEKPTGQ